MTSPSRPFRIDIWHNILWSKYKGEVFSAIEAAADKSEFAITYTQIAETEGNRVGLSGIDTAHHRYPYSLLFKGSIDQVPRFKRAAMIFWRTLTSDADIILLAGYEKLDYWGQLLAIKLRGKKSAVFCDSTVFDQPQKFWRGILKRIFFTSVDAIFCYGMRSKEYVLAYGADITHIYKRCQAAALPAGYDRASILADRIALAAKPEAPRYLYVGRLSPEKDLLTLLKSFAEVKKQIAQATLIIVGTGPQKDILEQRAKQLGISDAVSFTGGKSGAELFTEYSKATCLMLPSRSEPWGLVVNEAFSYGCPAIVSKHCGCVPELIVEGKTGYSHTAGSVDDLTQKMIASVSGFADIAATAEACLKQISTFTPQAAATEILGGLRNVLTGQGQA